MKFGLIGHPIAHSLSPALFKAGYDGRYQYELIESNDFEEAYSRFLNEYDGINVTAPFKELAYAKADILSEECKAIGATNLLIKTPEGVKAYNSDYLGVRMWLQEADAEMLSSIPASKRTPPTPSSWVPPPAARGIARFSHTWKQESISVATDRKISVLIVGMGGAGKAAAAAAESLGMKVTRMNRTVRDETTRPLEDFRECFREHDIIIYNIPTAIASLKELTEEDFIPGKLKYILEANYRNPSFDEDVLSRFIKADTSVRYTGGRIWLLYQALTGYEIFTGEKPDLRKMSDVL